VYDDLLAAMKTRGFDAQLASTGAEAKAALFRIVPPGAAVMAGASTTLDQIGVTDQLTHGGYDYIRAKIRATNDTEERHKLRARSLSAPFFLGSVAAVTRDGTLVAADNSGSRIGGYAFGPQTVVIVVSTKKVVPTLEDAMRRVREVAAPMEQQRVNSGGGPKYESKPRKWLLYESEATQGRTHVILVDEPLGF
jgi:L-lactate utilization protein LutB